MNRNSINAKAYLCLYIIFFIFLNLIISTTSLVLMGCSSNNEQDVETVIEPVVNEETTGNTDPAVPNVNEPVEDVDTDGDGIFDAFDNCPLIFNPNLLDTDQDSLGNLCDDDDDQDGLSDAEEFALGTNPLLTDTDHDGVADGIDAFPTDESEFLNTDGDNKGDNSDNCPEQANNDQADMDNDSIGDVCDSDRDGDGVNNDIDNCPNLVNANQLDVDANGVGDTCQGDRDSDGILDALDNCPDDINVDQADLDGDHIGDLCDNDQDNDTVNNADDNCPVDVNANQNDLDNDGLGDVCDDDADGDFVEDRFDNCIGVQNFDQSDIDNDGVGNDCDDDIDNDGVLNVNDNCKFTINPDQENLDGDENGDACDSDRDGDGVNNNLDNCAHVINVDQVDIDFDGLGDLCDDEFNDVDGDTIADAIDNCIQIANVDQSDLDTDTYGDACDNDIDGDLLTNDLDNCELVFNYDQTDTDQDGLGDFCDEDIDNDGVLNAQDKCFLVFNPDLDLAICSDDNDGDGILNVNDNCRFVSNAEQQDVDQDGIGDECDPVNWAWTRQMGSAGFDTPIDIVVDEEGNSYIIANVSSALEVGYEYIGPNDDFIVAKYNAAGDLLWIKQKGLAAVTDRAKDIALDADNNLYITGETHGPLENQNSFGLSDAFVMKMNSDGDVLWTSVMGGDKFDYAKALVIHDGKVFITGDTLGNIGDSQFLGGSRDIFVMSFDTDGEFQWVRHFGDDQLNRAYDFVNDANGNLYISGEYKRNTRSEVYLLKIDGDGNLVWETKQAISNANIVGLNLFLDLEEQNVFVMTHSNAALIEGVASTAADGSNDIVMFRFLASTGQQNLVKRYGTNTGSTSVNNVKKDAQGGVYLTGATTGIIDPNYNQANNGSDLFIMKLDGLFNPVWIFQRGTTDFNEGGFALDINQNGQINVVGSSQTNWDRQHHEGYNDIAIIRVDN
ncbi:hypothetical protein BVY03_01690 [bacterium K02(2017)]|nr:hypothetical protein BVY03_01690 [bacterium K02(2017)]